MSAPIPPRYPFAAHVAFLVAEAEWASGGRPASDESFRRTAEIYPHCTHPEHAVRREIGRTVRHNELTRRLVSAGRGGDVLPPVDAAAFEAQVGDLYLAERVA